MSVAVRCASLCVYNECFRFSDAVSITEILDIKNTSDYTQFHVCCRVFLAKKKKTTFNEHNLNKLFSIIGVGILLFVESNVLLFEAIL